MLQTYLSSLLLFSLSLSIYIYILELSCHFKATARWYCRWVFGRNVDRQPPLSTILSLLCRVMIGPLWAVLGCHGASVGGPGPLPGPRWAVLGRYQGLSGRSWVAPGASVGGPGLLVAEKQPWLEREQVPRGQARGPEDPLGSPSPSEVRQVIQLPGASTHFLHRYISTHTHTDTHTTVGLSL